MDPIEIVARHAAVTDGVITASQAMRLGVDRARVRDLCRAGRWRRLARGAYLVDPALGDEVPRRALIRAVVASFGSSATAVLQTAAELHGIAGLRRTDEVHVSVPGEAARGQRCTEPHVIAHQLSIPAAQIVQVDGIPATDPLATVASLIGRVDRYSAVCLLDSALNRELITSAEFASIPALIHGRRGSTAARRYLGEADGRAQSPLESRARLRCVDGRVPPDALQVPVRDQDGYLLGVGDLGWLAARVIAEADGAGPHATPQAVFEDRQRQNRMVNAGWVILRFTWADTLRPDYIPYVVRAALLRAVAR